MACNTADAGTHMVDNNTCTFKYKKALLVIRDKLYRQGIAGLMPFCKKIMLRADKDKKVKLLIYMFIKNGTRNNNPNKYVYQDMAQYSRQFDNIKPLRDKNSINSSKINFD